ncbi:helix-turn-helix domain-containing protein [Streptosporangium sp. NPDC000563]|uniref:TetR/AcrR family transcriptional regulator n=1 Tax=unclassified Streptosporangium TaxID=2632669 RepID=UPI00331F91D6
MTSTSQRATPLPPDERRAALIASTLSLVLAEGPDVSTRRIAQAAGVAEGTIFRVFATKDELVSVAIASAFDSSSLLGELKTIDRTAPLDVRLVEAVEILQRRTARIFRLVDAIGMKAIEAGHEHRDLSEESALIREALTGLIEPARERLRCEPSEAARRLQLLVIACTHPRLVKSDPLAASEVVSMLLDGVRLTAAPPEPLP